MSISNIVITLLATLLGGGSILNIFLFKENKKLKQAEIDKSYADGWKTLADERIKEAQYIKQKYDDVLAENTKLRLEKQEILVTMVGLCYERCKLTGCKNRQPDDETNQKEALKYRQKYSEEYLNKVKEFASSDI